MMNAQCLCVDANELESDQSVCLSRS